MAKPTQITISNLEAAYKRWLGANQAYLKARLDFDVADKTQRAALEGLRQDFLRKKDAVKSATEAYYALVNQDRPLSLSVSDESVLYTEKQIRELKERAKAIKLANSGQAT